MPVGRDVYFNLVGRSPVDRLLEGRLRVGLLTALAAAALFEFVPIQSSSSFGTCWALFQVILDRIVRNLSSGEYT